MVIEQTSGKKIAKKARREFRRTMKKEAEEMGRTIGNIMKPKPSWIPWWLWMRGLKIFIKVK